MSKKIITGVSGALLSLALGACTGKVNLQHPALAVVSPDTPVANVYFIRPRMLKPKGYSDGVLDIDLNGKKLLELHAGAYTLLKILPGKAQVSTHSMTEFTNQQFPIAVSRLRDYNFVAGKTYFIHIKRINEEFRGVFFDPESIELDVAKTLMNDVTSFGLARYEPIEYLESVLLPPEKSSDLPPTAPESLYPEEKYLLSPSPFK